jgi:hypothetical protein
MFSVALGRSNYLAKAKMLIRTQRGNRAIQAVVIHAVFGRLAVTEPSAVAPDARVNIGNSDRQYEDSPKIFGFAKGEQKSLSDLF